MKIRRGFVANSSSSSFAIMGFQLGKEKTNDTALLLRELLGVSEADIKKAGDEDGLQELLFDRMGTGGVEILLDDEMGLPESMEASGSSYVGISLLEVDSDDLVLQGIVPLEGVLRRVRDLMQRLGVEEEITILTGLRMS